MGSGQWAVGRGELAVGSWQLAVGSWQLAVGSWQVAGFGVLSAEKQDRPEGCKLSSFTSQHPALSTTAI